MPPADGQIERLIADLARAETAADACNPYSDDRPGGAVRRANLRLYLQAMRRRMPSHLLVMEAPGYRGCRLTGVPVTSRRILLQGLPALQFLGTAAGFRDVDEPGFERVYGEQSATIVWTALENLGVLPFIWNTFPFHPHKKGQPLSNRKPRRAETAQGAEFLRRVLELWDFRHVVAVGNVAYETLGGAGVDCVKIRHPAQGGKPDFLRGLQAVFAD